MSTASNRYPALALLSERTLAVMQRPSLVPRLPRRCGKDHHARAEGAAEVQFAQDRLRLAYGSLLHRSESLRNRQLCTLCLCRMLVEPDLQPIACAVRQAQHPEQ